MSDLEPSGLWAREGVEYDAMGNKLLARNAAEAQLYETIIFTLDMSAIKNIHPDDVADDLLDRIRAVINGEVGDPDTALSACRLHTITYTRTVS